MKNDDVAPNPCGDKSMTENATEQRFNAPYFVVIDHEQTVSDHADLQEARAAGQKACDAETIPCTFSIQDADGNHVEDIVRSDGCQLDDQIARFSALFGERRGSSDLT